MKKDITELYCFIEDFCRIADEKFSERLLSNGKKPTRIPEITVPEILTIILLYHRSPCKNFKFFYLKYLKLLYSSEFSKLPSYHRFVALKSRILWYLYQFPLLGMQIGDIAELFNCGVGKRSNKFAQSALKQSNCIVYFVAQNVLFYI